MKKIITTLALASAAFTSQAQVPASLSARLQQVLDSVAAKYKFKGLSAAVSYKNTGIWTAATGISDATTPLAPNMLIGIGSNTKTFVSTLILKFVESGKVNLEDTIGTWIQGYNNIPGNVTLRQVLNHTSGIASYTDNPAYNNALVADLDHMWTNSEVLQGFVLAPNFAPGTKWSYSNTNYIIASVIAEQIGGKPVYQLIRDSILTPQNLQHTLMPPFETTTDTYAHFWSNQHGTPALDEAANWNDPNFNGLPAAINSSVGGAGAMVSTAEDNVNFWKALMTGQIISKATLNNQMLKWTGFGNTFSDYGLGVFYYRVLNRPAVSHGGTWVGQINENLSDTASNIYVTVLSNQDSLQNEFVDIAVTALYRTALNHNPTLSVADIVDNPSIRCYPNPASNQLKLELTDQQPETAVIMDITGKVWHTQAITPGTKSATIDLANLADGLYILTLKGENSLSQTRFTVVH
jgi:D-alanyl-D-alanine carboxypeptidase